ncbi:MAG: hypothetical protein Q4C53_09605 [Clostridia bacterium]|nr:hypothetical protein [Clostridia bacterium]
MTRYPKCEELARLSAAHPGFSPYVLLKLSMVLHGAVLSEAALRRLQADEYRFGEAEPFDIGFSGRTAQYAMPGPVLLADGTFVYINYGEAYADPYVIGYDAKTDTFPLLEGDKTLCAVDFVPRPAFFGKRTTKGTPMASLADVRAQKLILTAYRGCDFWRGGDRCGFCAFFTGGGAAGPVVIQDIQETVREALKEPGRFSELYLSGGSDFSGTPAFENELERYIRVWQAIGEDFTSRFPSQLMAPAYTKRQLRRLYDETKITSYCPNIEVWDKELFRSLCPGKQKHVGYEEWLRRTCDAVEVFGKGNVYTQMVAGAELAKPGGFPSEGAALASNLEACDFFAKHGVVFLSTIWRPHKAARLGFQPMPSLDYYVNLSEGLHDIRAAYGLTLADDDYKTCGNHPDSDLCRLDRAEATAGIPEDAEAKAKQVRERYVLESGEDAETGLSEDVACGAETARVAVGTSSAEAGNLSLPCGLCGAETDTMLSEVTVAEFAADIERLPLKCKGSSAEGGEGIRLQNAAAGVGIRLQSAASEVEQEEFERAEGGGDAVFSVGKAAGVGICLQSAAEASASPDLSFTDADLASAVLCVPDENGGTFPFRPTGLCLSEDGDRFELPLASEHTEAGRGIPRAMWFGHEVALYLAGKRLSLRPARCHITGKTFARHYLAAKRTDPLAEVAAVWSFSVLSAEPCAAPAPAPLPLHTDAQELHLDHPSLRK